MFSIKDTYREKRIYQLNKNMRDLKKRLLLISGIGFFLFSCNSSSDNFRSNKIFTYNQISGISSLDPAFASLLSNIWAVNQLYDGLIQLDSNSKIIPGIAKRWNMNANGTEYVFHLRQDVFFNNDSCFSKNE